MAGEQVKVVNHMPELVDALHQALAEAISSTAGAIATEYTATAPRDTGFMAESAYVVTAGGSTYGASGGAGPLADPVADAAENDTTAYAGVGAEYAAAVEFGGAHSAAQPAFYPAADRGQQTFEAELGKIEGKLKAVGGEG